MSDLLSSASLIIAIIGTFYVFVYPFVNEVLELKLAENLAENKENYKKVISVRNRKLFPLTSAAIPQTLVFIPELIRRLSNSFDAIKHYGISFKYYDTVT